MGRPSRYIGSILACVLLAMLAIPAAAGAKSGALDRGFNGDGKVVTVFPDPESIPSYPNYQLPFEFAPGRVAMADGPQGKLVAANSEAIVQYLPNGRRDRGFGGNGAVPIESIDGFRFQLAEIAVDSQNRVLIAGTTKATNGLGMEGQSLAGPLPSIATIRRYKANGAPDPSFGAEGVIHTFFGAPPPTFDGQPYPESAVSLIGLAVDGRDRPIVTGSLVAEVGRCGTSQDRFERSNAFVARLTDDGGPDPTFESGATRGIRELSWLGSPTPTPGAQFFAVGANHDPCHSGGPGEPTVVVGIGDNGPGPPFGGDGFWSRRFMRVSDVAAAPGGKIVLLARTVELSRGRWVESAGSAIRLRGNGSLDRNFGRRGEAQVRLPKRASIAAIATDAKGRVLLAGTVKRTLRHAQRTQLRFLLIRTTATGRTDRRFGHRGRVTTGFGNRTNVRATDVLIDRANRIAVGGKFSGPKDSGGAFALARFLAGR